MIDTSVMHHQGDRARRIMAVAAQLFHAQGYEAVSLRQIAQLSGISSGSLYYHIESKQSLLADIIDEALSRLVHASSTADMTQRTPDQRLAVLVRIFMSHVQQDRLALGLAFREVGRMTDLQRAEIEQLHQRYRVLLGLAISARCGMDVNHPRLNQITSSILAVLKSQLYDEAWLVEEEAEALLCGVVDALVQGLDCRTPCMVGKQQMARVD